MPTRSTLPAVKVPSGGFLASCECVFQDVLGGNGNFVGFSPSNNKAEVYFGQNKKNNVSDTKAVSTGGLPAIFFFPLVGQRCCGWTGLV